MISKIIILFCLNFLFYARTTKYKYVSDDLPIVHNPPKFRNKWHKAFLILIGQGKFNSVQDHLVTIFIHGTICVFIYLGFGANNISFLAALLFMFNPANNQVSIWISGRGYSLPAISLVMAISFPWLAPLILFGGSWFTAGFPALLVFIFSPYWWFIFFIPLIWWLHFKKFKTAVVIKFKAESFTEDKKIHPRKLILAIKTYGFYLALGLIPFKLSFYHSFLQSCAGNKIMRAKAYKIDCFFWIGLTGIIYFIFLVFHPWSLTFWGLWWFSIAIAPYCNLRRMNQEISERFSYIAYIGLMLFLASLIINYPFLIIIFLTMYIIRIWFYMPAYTDDYWIVEYSVTESPDSWFAWHMRALKRWEMHSHREALNMWVMCKLLSPQEFKILINIHTVLRYLKLNQEAAVYLKIAKENVVEGQEAECKKLFDEIDKGLLPIIT